MTSAIQVAYSGKALVYRGRSTKAAFLRNTPSGYWILMLYIIRAIVAGERDPDKLAAKG